jgi:hypothetical protein
MPSQAAEGLRHRERLKTLNAPLSLNNFISSSPRPPEIVPVCNTINTMTRICAASAVIDIIRRDKEENSCLTSSTLDRVSALSKSLWKEISLLPLSTIPSLQNSLTIYERILVEIQQILNSSDPLRMLDDTMDRQLDDFLFHFQEALDPLRGTSSQRNSPKSTHFFENSHHILISGGTFSSNPVIHDPVVREESHKILQVLYIQCGVLFG